MKTKGYKIDFVNMTVIMNYKFAAAANQYGTDEYDTLVNIKEDYPNIKVVVKSGRNCKKANASKNMTYKNMERYIKVQDNAKDYLKLLEKTIEESKTQKSPYGFVREWFVKQFPEYKYNNIFDGEKVISLAAQQSQEIKKIA